jgi:defect-in-organelle-trafficking protein DotB
VVVLPEPVSPAMTTAPWAGVDSIQHRFRINVTAGYYEGDVGVQIVCRHIPAEPPTDDLHADIALVVPGRDVDAEPVLDQLLVAAAARPVEGELVAESTPAQGAVVIAGETGSGKTTTLAALIP